MRVLIVDSVKNDRDVAARFLGGAGHTVTLATDLKAAQSTIEQDPPEAIVLDPSNGIAAALAFLKAIRNDPAKHPHVLLLAPKLATGDLTSLLHAGADDFMRKPFERDDLVLRVSGGERIAKWAPAVFGAGGASETSSSNPFDALKSWANVDAASAKDVGQLLQKSLVATAQPDVLAGAEFGAGLCLTYTAKKLDVRFTIGAKRPSLERAAEQVFGTSDNADDALQDVVRELANLTAGGFKGAAAGEAIALTMGLPFDIGQAGPPRVTLAARSFVIHDPDKTIEIGVLVEVLSSPLKTVKVSDLKEGMVLAHDVLNASGGMLVPAGRLTQLRIARVFRALPPKAELEVAHADDAATG